VAHRAELRAVLRECLSSRSSEECVALLSGQQIVAGAVRGYAQVLNSPDLAASGLIVDAVGADGTRYQALGLPYRIDDAPRTAPPAAPACGADTDALLAEVGYGVSDIAALRRDGVIA
jgi:crotonobetainyl-CoA:carnitine CoA-transferase CaiB-like acyl-CoA transferase